MIVRGGIIVIAGVIALLAFSVIFGSWYQVPEGYRGVITRNGAFVGIAQPGLGFKLPIVDGVEDMSIQTQRANFEGMEAYSKDIQQSTNYVTVNYRLAPDAVEKMYREVGVEYASRIFNARVFKHLKEAYGKFTAADIVNKRDQVSNAIEDALRTDVLAYGIIVDDVQLANIDFSDQYEKSIEEAAMAQAQVNREKQVLEQIKVSALQQVEQANAKALAIKAEADANAYAKRVSGEAEGARLYAEYKGRAEGLELLSRQITPEYISYLQAQQWNGILPTSMVPNGALPFINLSTTLASR